MYTTGVVYERFGYQYVFIDVRPLLLLNLNGNVNIYSHPWLSI